MTTMPSVYVLYRKSLPKEIRYVGITKHDDVNKRFEAHMYKSKIGVNRPVNDWINKYYPDIECKKVCSSSWEGVCAEEKILIARLKAEGHRLLNMTEGGEGTYGLKDSEDTKIKKSRALTGRKVSQETREKISKSNTGKKRSAAARKKMSEKKKGKKLTKDHIAKISLSGRGRIVSSSTRKKMSEAQKGRKFTAKHYANLVEGQKRRRKREALEKGKVAE